jgi:DNA-binding beta-propeller fold protein YncE
MRTWNRLVWTLCFSCALLCCDDPSTPELPSSQSSTPVVLDEQLVFVEAGQRLAYLLDLSQPRPRPETTRFQLPPAPGLSARRNEHNEALILCAGERGSTTSDAVEGALVVLSGDGKVREYGLGTAPFDTFEQSVDGRYAIVHRSNVTQGRLQDRILDNPNELVVVDLDREPADSAAITRKTPAGLGHTLTHVLVSPAMTIANEERRLLIVLSAAEVSIFDLAHLERRATIVQLDQTRSIDPLQVVFSSDQPTFYLRATSSDNIFMFRFEPFENTEGGNDFQPSINPLSGGVKPRDIALFGAGTSERLLVLATQQVLVIDPASSKTTRVPLQADAEQMLVFKAGSPHDSREQTRVLLYSPTARALTFFDPEGLGDEPSDSVEQLVPQQPVLRLLPLLDEKTAVLLQSNLVTVLDLEQRTLTPISSSSQLSDALFDPVRKKLWVGPAGSPYIQSLDLSNGRTGDELRLDAPIQTLLPLFQQGRMLALHTESIGYLTVIDADSPDREHALSLRGYFVNQLFDRSEP